MDDAGKFWYYPAIMRPDQKIPSWQLYGEESPFPDLLHIEQIVDRAAGLDWQIAPHRHLHLHQMFLIQSGQLQFSIDGHSAHATPAVLMNIPRGAVHGFAFAARTEGYVLTLPTADFPELFGPLAETLAPLQMPFVGAPPPELTQAFAALFDLHAAPHPLRRLRLRAATLTICCAVAECVGQSDTPASLRDPRIQRFETQIRSQLSSGWTLSDHARALALSERHLRRLCLQATGLSAGGFIDAIRLREACRLLAYTRMRVQDVGFALGFDDPAYFARAFRRGMGMSPGDYRVRLER